MKDWPCLSTKLWLEMTAIHYWLCLIFVVSQHCTWQINASNSNNTTFQPCICNSTNGTVQKACNCPGNSTSCPNGYFWSNNGCIQCTGCNATESPCSCPNRTKPTIKVTSCASGYFLLNTSDGAKCANCSCNPGTSLGANCDNLTGQCVCKPGVLGRQCNACMVNYTSWYSNGSLLNCSQCPVGQTRIPTTTFPFYECKKQSSTVSTETPTSTIMISGISPTTTRVPSSMDMISTILTSTEVLTSTSKALMLNTILSNQQSTTTTLATPTHVLLTSRSATLPNTVPTNSPSTSLPTSMVTTTTVTSPPTTTSIPPTTTQLATTPASTSTEPPPVTTPISTGKPVTEEPTTHQVHTDETEPTTQTTDYPITTEQSTNKAKAVNDEDSSDVITIVLVSIGVFLVLGVVIALGCWYLRATRKPSAPFWTVELSNTTRNEELDFALLDPITDQPHTRLEEVEMDTPPLGNTRYCAYI